MEILKLEKYFNGQQFQKQLINIRSLYSKFKISHNINLFIYKTLIDTLTGAYIRIHFLTVYCLENNKPLGRG